MKPIKEHKCKKTCLECDKKDECEEFQERMDLFLRTRT